MAFWSWSRTASSNATADSTINYSEGQAPSSVNDSARAAMARLREFADDVTGAIVTGGTSTAYTVTSFEVFDTLAHMNGQMIAFSPHATNGATVTLNVDGLGAKPLRSAPSVELLAGTIIQGTPYVALYNNSDAAFYLQSFYGNPYNVPLAGGLDYWGATAPNSSFAFPSGQAISRTTYATMFAIVGTAHGAGDGSTTFNLPDLRGRIATVNDALGGSDATRLSGAIVLRTTVGGTGGLSTATLNTSNLPAYTPAGTVNTGTVAFNNANISSTGGGGTGNVTTGGFSANAALTLNAATISGFSFTGSAQGGSSQPFFIVQPAIICNYILRII